MLLHLAFPNEETLVAEVNFEKCRKGLQRSCDLKIAIRDMGLLNIAGKWKTLPSHELCPFAGNRFVFQSAIDAVDTELVLDERIREDDSIVFLRGYASRNPDKLRAERRKEIEALSPTGHQADKDTIQKSSFRKHKL
jgi:hypothetical protein